jgi:hypothetical protein
MNNEDNGAAVLASCTAAGCVFSNAATAGWSNLQRNQKPELYFRVLLQTT